ncbi:tripartite tricarboxylate transporter substrate binding protein [Ramlibacter sp. G-1-2-2]|uniref:Tripartite tricarboxylate transporter substrate binding protein n=1 Tax=Ramlibacter agri TaxID=2728837 RepID=A0A848GZD4_9BURK|nr:tripartite tricarboxylate transporter substrate binding protein [Ramlibacter agri]NML43527.1 tripartite tricarboxylate transporter substrate binding protein [Ramlibacter agri]
MNRMTRRALAGIAIAFAAATAGAQQYPSRTITLVVPFPAGGVTDVVARAVASRLSTELGQTVVVENKAGASGVPGTAFAARAAADGYTLLLGNISTLGTNPATFAKLPYDPAADFTPVSLLASQPLVIAVHPSVPAQNLKELVALAKAKPGTLSFGTAGTSIQLAVELFDKMNGIKMLHVPYKGSAPAITDLVGGQINVLFDPISTLYPMVKAGKVRGLGVTTKQRSPAAPELPSAQEAGTPGYDVSSWQALVVPAGTPAPIVQRLHAAVAKVLAMPETRELFAKQGAVPTPTSPEEAGQYIRSELARWKEVAQEAGVKPE